VVCGDYVRDSAGHNDYEVFASLQDLTRDLFFKLRSLIVARRISRSVAAIGPEMGADRF